LNRDSLLSVYDRLTGLVEKLPGGLQKPILRELTPIRKLFLEQRPARILLLGGSSAPVAEILAGVGARDAHVGGSDNGWRTYSLPGRSAVEILDGRAGVPHGHLEAGVARWQPDVILLLEGRETSGEAWGELVARCGADSTPIVAVAGDKELRIQARLSAEAPLAPRVAGVFGPGDPAIVEVLCASLPLPAQLAFARLTNARRAQAHIAGSLLKSFSAVCGVIGAQPIPLADMPILMTLQSLMVGMIIHTTGRPFSVRLAAEFLGALGVNVGLGVVLREGARALVRVVPIWGNVVSGFVAGAGTYAVGRAAISYFIEDTPIRETRKIFQRLLPRFGRKQPPRLPELPG